MYSPRCASQNASGAHVLPAYALDTVTMRWSDQCTRSVDSQIISARDPRSCALPKLLPP
ncbi:Uncharacterised protein [Mycobacteroides abscessus]|nr:Uncharacterised protein [Mycobacteroides abscessus]